MNDVNQPVIEIVADDVYRRNMRAKECVDNAYNRSKNFLNPFFSKYRTFYEMYRGFQSNKNYYGRANLFIPKAFENIENINARVLKAYNGIRTSPGNSKTLIKNAENAKRVLTYQEKEYNFKSAFADAWQDAGIYGDGYLKVLWCYQPDGRVDHPFVKAMDPAEYFFDPDATSRLETRYEIHQQWTTIDQLRANPLYDKAAIDKLERAVPKDSAPTQGPNAVNAGDNGDALKNSRYAAIGVNQPMNVGKLQAREYWGLFNLEEDGNVEECRIVTAGEEVLLVERNPNLDLFPEGVVDQVLCRPFIHLKYTDVAHQFLGVGMIEPILRLLEELNDTRNQRMDNVTLIVDQMYYVLDSADVNEDDFIARGGGIIYGSVENGVTPLPRGDVTESSYKEEQVIKDDILSALGLSPLTKGDITGLSGEALHTVLAVLESGNVVIDQKTAQFKDAVSQTMRMVLALDQALLDKGLEIPSDDAEEKDGKMIFPILKKADLAGSIRIDVEMDTQMSQILRRAEAQKLYAELKGDPNINQQVNTRLYLESLDRDAWITELMTLPPPAPKPPEEPKRSISIALKGDLNTMQSADIATIMGAKPESGDPILDDKMRMLMKGKDPAEMELALKQADLHTKMAATARAAKDNADAHALKQKELALKEREVNAKIPPPAPTMQPMGNMLEEAAPPAFQPPTGQ